ncbi:diaminopimelate epimerase [Sulfurimonas sp.]|jgi:diaminopimelate epimerase|uniref:diaminopimelate epimerase n=1 Tax=Sulfurimonas sp. TaxID=2022749 RepID=UPI0025E25119|nr:diaminopimelate epimerase [Sulfurimonas sp.]MCK9472235.1 diaminopimelate epimerase [Sulfurimonas sp.]MDD3505211.1 diaminopimelate epimerase [Sulfurimonas sp.]
MIVSKYSANGNDFVIFHTFVKKDRSQEAKKLCHRQEGVGADGLIVLVPYESQDSQKNRPTIDFEWQFYNSDGSEAEMCGNGSRACAHYAFINELAPSKMSFLTVAGVINAEVEASDAKGGMVLSELTSPKILDTNIEHNGKKWYKLNTGVPHLVHITQNIEEFDIAEARELRKKYNANVNIVFVDGKNLRVRTYERGVEDETLACGTGMAASFYIAYKEGLVSNNIEVYPRSGDTLYLGVNDRSITFKGMVKRVFTAEV